jgi:CBS domain-containing protein
MEALVDSIMAKKPETVELDLTVLQAAGILAKRMEHCLIVAKDDFVLGIVTPSDMVDKVLAAGANPVKVYVRDIMSTPVITVGAKSTVGKAAELMSQYGVGRLPAVDDAGALIGLITSVELARYLAKMNDFQDPALNALAKLKKEGEDGPYK